MKEYDIYLPLHYNDGTAIEPQKVDHCKKLLVEEFGGLTHFLQSNEGLWKFGGVTFRDRVNVVRVLSDSAPRAKRFFSELRIELMRELEQADILIVEREVTLVT